MRVVYARTEPPEAFTRAIFLAGPTPRSREVPSWRPRALELLAERGFDGVVFVPEDQGGGMSGGYTPQIEWEEACLNLADCVAFWVPRELEAMPAFTTNVEWGVWCGSGKAVFGAPPAAPKTRYLRHYAEKLGVPQAETLEGTLDAALALLGEGALRRGGEREVPLYLWRQEGFQAWYRAQRAAGNRLDGARLEWRCLSGPKRRSLFCWALRVNLHIPAEGRNKRSEVIVTRPDVSAVLAYHRGAGPGDARVVLVREMRSAALTSDGMVHELPGGSSPHGVQDPRQIAAEELQEETGIRLAASRFVAHPARQIAPTMLTHRAHLFSVELSLEELRAFEAEEGVQHGEGSSERTYVELRRVSELLASPDVDWSTLGMILSVLGEPP
jgi:8-oxo-dGTP pyrophosphatase MutT (NUDIX family)